jgi:hypothetical protein
MANPSVKQPNQYKLPKLRNSSQYSGSTKLQTLLLGIDGRRLDARFLAAMILSFFPGLEQFNGIA